MSASGVFRKKSIRVDVSGADILMLATTGHIECAFKVYDAVVLGATLTIVLDDKAQAYLQAFLTRETTIALTARMQRGQEIDPGRAAQTGGKNSAKK
jgi:hypothetical protein